jgi:hypothetical protein
LKHRDYTDEATKLFERIAAKHQLIYEVEDQAEVELLWSFPVQPKLIQSITLGLQNWDELNFGVERFWSYFFPFEDVAERFEFILDAWVEGRARIGIVGLGGRMLQLEENGVWQIAYSANIFLPAWRKPNRYFSNAIDEAVTS